MKYQNTKGKMAGNAVWYNIFIFTFLNIILKTRITVTGNSDGFLQANNEVQYISVHKEFQTASRIRMPVPTLVEDSSVLLRFDPPLLDFKERHLGIPHHEKVMLFNIDNNKTIHMSSISGSTVHFHSSFFDDKVVPPLGNTTFNVVFLGREEGEIESNLFIHTSEGSFRYQVRGASVSSPYRLRPLVGVRLPLNSTYCPLIHVYNPFPLSLQVVEAYSSGGDFHLELPSGGLEGPPDLWEIPPFHTKPVIKLRFVAQAQKNHTAYVRLRVSHSEEALVVPLEVQVGPRPGLYSHDDLLDFGLGGSCDQPRQLRLLLYNSGPKPVRIQSIVAKPASKALRIDFQPIKVPPDSRLPTRVAVLTFNWSAEADGQQVSGRILVRGKQGQHKLVLPYVARPLRGCLSFNASLAQFCSEGERARAPRRFSVSNTFQVPVAVLNVSLHREAQPYFQVENFVPKVFGPGEGGTIFHLSLSRTASVTDLKLETNLWLHTNVSRVFVPVLCYNGRLDLVCGPRLDLGLVGVGRGVLRHVAAVNRNPVGVQLLSWDADAAWASVRLLGVARGNASLALAVRVFHNLTNSTLLPPGHYAVFAVSVLAPQQEGDLHATLELRTQFESVVVPLSVQVAHGYLQVLPDPLLLTDCFPGKACEQRLDVRSHFLRAMAVRAVEGVPADPRLQFLPRGETAVVAPLSTTTLGRLRFDCAPSHCYLGTHHNSSGSSQWLQTLGLPLRTADLDTSLFSSQRHQFQHSPRTLQLTLQLDTTAVRNHLFQAEVQLSWPLLANWSQSGGVVQFPLTQVGNTSSVVVSLHNPSGHTVVVQLVLDWVYPRASHVLHALASWLGGCEGNYSQGTSSRCFSWAGSEGARWASQELLGVPSHRDGLTVVLRPGETALATLAFSPLSVGHHSALLFVRNNLTVLEVLRVSGHAALPLFKFGNRKPGSGTPLLFELAEKHLKDCSREKNRVNPAPNLTVKRSFTARNYGDLPIYLSGFSINGLPCEGYGFKILNCESFVLLPNQTRKVDIAFTPDFTLARIQRTLSIETSLGSAVNYTLITTLPPFFLAACSAVLGRPTWEPLLYYSVVSLVVFLLFCVLAAAYLEADRIIKGALVSVARGARGERVLDLNKLAEPAEKPAASRVKTGTWGHAEDRRPSSLGEGDPRPQMPAAAHKYIPKTVLPASLSPLLPVKSKKKLSKKVSAGDSSEAPGLKKSWGGVVFPQGAGKMRPAVELDAKATASSSSSGGGGGSHAPVKKGKEALDATTSSSTTAAKCTSRAFKKNKASPDVLACSEEETSSTTTDSSNNDDMDKERNGNLSDRSHHKQSPQKAKEKCAADYKDSYEGDCDDDEYCYEREVTRRKDLNLRWKAGYKASSAVGAVASKPAPEARPPHCDNRASNLELPYKLKSSKSAGRDRKDKLTLKRRFTDKVATLKSGVVGLESRSAAQLRPASCWNEMKASFSDVVARTESPSYSSVVAPRTSLLADVRPSVDCSAPSTLGPIGSKITASSGTWESFLEPVPPHFLQHEPASSLFLAPFPDNLQDEDNHRAVHADAERLWDDPVATSLDEPTVKSDDPAQANLFTETWPASLWDPLCTPAVADSSALFPAPGGDDAGSVWGNFVTSVWSSDNAWSPASSGQPAPSAAAAAAAAPGSDDHQDAIDPGLGFNPFHSLNNIWLPRSSDNTWSPPGGED